MAVALGATALGGGGALAVFLFEFGPLSTHMAWHIALMNVLAPGCAIALERVVWTGPAWLGTASPWPATIAQIAVLWSWHLPTTQALAAGSQSGAAAMHASMFLAGFCFWRTLLALEAHARWQAVLALLLTGKVACLLGALLVFAPRPLYAHHHAAAVVTLDDQHLAGLLMIAACSLSYVLVGVVVAAQIIADLGRSCADGQSPAASR